MGRCSWHQGYQSPDVLNEEVADTALGLLLCTVRQLPQAMRYLQAGKWQQAP